MTEKTTFTWSDWRGRETTREVNLTLNILDFKSRKGFPWLLMASNPDLSVAALVRVMAHYGYERTRSWVSRRRWLFVGIDHVRRVGGAARNVDGQEERATKIMSAHPHVSTRELTRILQRHGIRRGKTWVSQHRPENKDAEAIQFLKDNPDLSIRSTVKALGKLGIRRGKDWVSAQRQGQ